MCAQQCKQRRRTKGDAAVDALAQAAQHPQRGDVAGAGHDDGHAQRHDAYTQLHGEAAGRERRGDGRRQHVPFATHVV
jgi:hypothetical protein